MFLFLANGLLLAACSQQYTKYFMLPSDCAKATVSTAKTISTWVTKHQSEAERFEESLVSSLNSCLQHAKVKSEKINRERMWCAYHALRTSDRYVTDWETFLQSAGITEVSVTVLSVC